MAVEYASELDSSAVNTEVRSPYASILLLGIHLKLLRDLDSDHQHQRL
jgi:hypothetical protein